MHVHAVIKSLQHKKFTLSHSLAFSLTNVLGILVKA